MGKDLFTQFPELEREADDVLGYSVRELCTEDPRGQLGNTEYTQPALFVVNALSYLERQKRGAPAPAFLAGHSLGEYNALWVAGCFDFGTGLRLVKRRGELMAQAKGGSMAAVVGLERSAVEGVLAAPGLGVLDLANLNTPKQLVVAGPADALQRARAAFERAGATFIPLPVSAAFHSRYMAGAQEEFGRFLESFELRDPELPVVSNVTARLYEPGCVRETLCRQLRSAVHWCDSVRYLLGRGPMRFEEVGQGDVLTRMIAQIEKLAPPATGEPAPSVPKVPRARASQAGEAPGGEVTPESLGSAAFRQEYGVRLAYVSGSMYRGIASEALVARMARSRLLSFFGTAGLSPERTEQAILRLRAQLPRGAPFGMNLLNTPSEAELVECFLRHGVDVVEASAYVAMSEPLVRYRTAGLRRTPSGEVRVAHRVVAKVSRPEVAELFLRPAPERLLRALVEARKVTPEQARLAAHVPMADDLCVEADSGGHTDGGVALVLLPSMRRLCERLAREAGYRQPVRVGLAGGIGTPEAVLAAFVLGADFVLTGSINQCTVEAGHSDTVKDMLESIDVQDTDYAPAGDMFELGAQVQVLKRGVFFPSRARRLFELYRNFRSLEELDPEVRKQLERSYFQRSFDEVFAEVKKYRSPEEIARAERDPHHKMTLVFKWYFAHTNELAFRGRSEDRTQFQVHCGPALGAFNRWVRGTELASWRPRHVDDLAERLMAGAAALLDETLSRSPRARRSEAPGPVLSPVRLSA
jgi:trans-AT polyketide synthase/acyltransferase/oxidoreductase domain-containing protein